MHRRELTALSTAARTRVHISLLLVARREFCAPSIASRSSTCVRAPRERDGHASRQRCARLPGPHGSRFCAWHSGERYGTCVMEFLFFPSTAGGRAHGTLLASLAAVPRRHMLYLRRYCHIICTIGHEVPPRIEVRLQDLHERGSVTAPVLRAANTCFDGLDGRRRRRPGARRRPSIARRPTSRVCALCGNQNFTARSESSRRPPRHRRDARSMAWRCGLSPLDSASTAAFSPREGFDID